MATFITQRTTFERTVYVAEYHAMRALAAGHRNNDRQFARHKTIMFDLIDGSEWPDAGYEELGRMVGRKKAVVLDLIVL
jgi:hypothetical protein